MRLIAIELSLLASILHGKDWIISDTYMNYDQAEAYCVAQGSHLATISNLAEQDEAAALCQANDANLEGCWCGLFHDDSSNTWKWKDGSALGYGFNADGSPTTGITPWIIGEPSNSGDCIQLRSGHNYGWNDKTCTASQLAICNPQGK